MDQSKASEIARKYFDFIKKTKLMLKYGGIIGILTIKMQGSIKYE
nr:hypothetical protein [uncultured Desulfobacter sp.]